VKGNLWIKKLTKDMLEKHFPREVKTGNLVPQGLKPNTLYKAIGIQKHRNRYVFIISMNNDEIFWGAEYFEMEV